MGETSPKENRTTLGQQVKEIVGKDPTIFGIISTLNSTGKAHKEWRVDQFEEWMLNLGNKLLLAAKESGNINLDQIKEINWMEVMENENDPQQFSLKTNLAVGKGLLKTNLSISAGFENGQSGLPEYVPGSLGVEGWAGKLINESKLRTGEEWLALGPQQLAMWLENLGLEAKFEVNNHKVVLDINRRKKEEPVIEEEETDWNGFWSEAGMVEIAAKLGLVTKAEELSQYPVLVSLQNIFSLEGTLEERQKRMLKELISIATKWNRLGNQAQIGQILAVRNLILNDNLSKEHLADPLEFAGGLEGLTLAQVVFGKTPKWVIEEALVKAGGEMIRPYADLSKLTQGAFEAKT